MRNLTDYEAEYTQPGFEDILVQYRRKSILKEMNKAHARRVVEIGCGMQPLFLFYSNFERYFFFEPGDAFFGNAEQRAKEIAADRIQGIHAPFTFQEEVCGAKPDFIICASLLHELENPEAMLADIWRTASPDTVIHLNVPNALSFHRRLARAMGLMKDEREFSDRNRLLQQHRVFDRDSLLEMVEGCGLEVVDQGTVMIKPFAHDQMWHLVQDGFMTEKMLDGLSRLAEELPELGSEIWVNCKIRPSAGGNGAWMEAS